MADRIANDYRIRGESKSGIPVPYFTHSEELVALKFLDIVIQNDPRKFLKTREKEIMINRWKQDSPKQSQWFSLHPTQILNRTKSVWLKAIHMGDGRMWLFFIFALCQCHLQTTGFVIHLYPAGNLCSLPGGKRKDPL